MSSKENEVVDILCEFFEVVIHNVLFIRKLYPDCIFVKRKKYGVVVYRSVHPQLNEYITECLKAAKFHLKSRLLHRIIICTVGPDIIYERFVLDVLSLEGNFEKDLIYLKLEQNLRDFCLKLQTACSYLDDLPNTASFRIMLHTTEYSNLAFNSNPVFADFPWLCVKEHEYKISAPDIIPMHTVETDHLVLQIFVEKNSL